jgi:putative ABC transport system ATP-binding protein
LLDGRKPDERQLKSIIERLGLQERLTHLPSQLSGGQQQRVSIGRALINNPALMLADEPTGNLDSENSKEIISLLRQFNRELGQTVIMITHDENIALSADRLIEIKDGKIVRDERRL